jgi:hypothetical protein
MILAQENTYSRGNIETAVPSPRMRTRSTDGQQLNQLERNLRRALLNRANYSRRTREVSDELLTRAVGLDPL